MDEDVRVVPFPNQTQTPEVQREDAVADALERVGDIPVAKVEAVAALERRPNWPAIITFIAISMLSLSVAVFSTGADDVLRMGAAMALVISILTGGLAVLYRHAPTFWRPGIAYAVVIASTMGDQNPTPRRSPQPVPSQGGPANFPAPGGPRRTDPHRTMISSPNPR
jgi:hypothetical protein